MSKRGKQFRQEEDVEVCAQAATAAHCGLSVEQAHALAAFRRAHGRCWKAALIDLWTTGRDERLPDGALLRQVRNNQGPRWLKRYRPNAEAPQPREASITVRIP